MNTTATIITHSGRSHESDFLSVCLLLAALPHKVVEVHRRSPSSEELLDPHCYVVDIGEKWEPAISNFDYRSNIRREDKPLCSFSLVLKYFNMYEAAKEAWPSLTYIEYKDVLGIEAAISYYFHCMKVKDTLPMITSNIARSMLEAFSKVEVLRDSASTACLYYMMKDVIGMDMVRELRRIKERVLILRKFVRFGDTPQGLRYADAREVPTLQTPELGYYTLFKEEGENVDILFSKDTTPKSKGNIILRWEDPTNPSHITTIDFRDVIGDSRVSYIHTVSKRNSDGLYEYDETDPENGKFLKTWNSISLDDMYDLVKCSYIPIG